MVYDFIRRLVKFYGTGQKALQKRLVNIYAKRAKSKFSAKFKES